MKLMHLTDWKKAALGGLALWVVSHLGVQAGLISFTGVAVTNAQDRNGASLAGGQLSFLVVDTFGDGFATLLDGMTIRPGAVIPGTDDWVVMTNQTSAGNFGTTVSGFTGDFDNASNDIDLNDPFGVFFFEDSLLNAQGDASVALEVGDYYGFSSNADWKIPTDGNYLFPTNFTSAGGVRASSQVMAAVPEPNGALFLGLGWFVYVLGFRRNRKGNV